MTESLVYQTYHLNNTHPFEARKCLGRTIKMHFGDYFSVWYEIMLASLEMWYKPTLYHYSCSPPPLFLSSSNFLKFADPFGHIMWGVAAHQIKSGKEPWGIYQIKNTGRNACAASYSLPNKFTCKCVGTREDRNAIPAWAGHQGHPFDFFRL